MRSPFFLFLAAAFAPGLLAQDIIHRKDGSTREVRVMGMEGDQLRVGIPSPVPGRPGGSTTVSLAEIERIEFGPDTVLEALGKNKTAASIAAARVRWQSLEPLLALPESRAGEAGCLYGEVLLLSPEPADHEAALAVFSKVEQGAWSPADREAAVRGRLRAMLALGRLEEAAREAEAMSGDSGDPDFLIETKLVLAEARLAELEKLLADNPRWYQDPPVKAERSRLLNEAADLSLYPFLFHGTQRELSAKGLALAHRLYQLVGDKEEAAKVAEDLAVIYPETPEARSVSAEKPTES
jgi:hypothetical protein